MPYWAWRWIAPLLFISPLAMLLVGIVMDLAKVQPNLARWLMRTGATIVCAFMVIGGVVGVLADSGNGIDWQALAVIGLIVVGTEAVILLWKRFRRRD